MKEISLYFHIPFCRRACPYCDFYFTTRQSEQKFFFQSLLEEIKLRKDQFASSRITSIYFGGGTPSLSEVADLAMVLLQVKAINSSLSEDLSEDLSEEAEITLEMNFEDITFDKIKSYREIGINRLSIGIQSIRKSSLPYLARYVEPASLVQVAAWLRELKMMNYSFDLIYGFPVLSNAHWISDLKKIIDLKPCHLSLYSLSVEKHTRLAHLIDRKKLPPIDEALAREHFLAAKRTLENHGYEHYEISSWAREKRYSKHNLNYWSGEAYLGFGPSAHSYYQGKRFFNPPHLKSYLDDLLIHKKLKPEIEELSLANQINENIMLSLRTMWGINLTTFQIKFGENEKANLLAKAAFLVRKNLLKREGHRLKATQRGQLLLDTLTRELLV